MGCPRGRLKHLVGFLWKKVCVMRHTFLETSGRPGWAGRLHPGTSPPALPSFFHSFIPSTATLTQFKGFNTIRLRKWFFKRFNSLLLIMYFLYIYMNLKNSAAKTSVRLWICAYGAVSFIHPAPKKSFKILKKTNVGDNMLRHKNALTEPIIACSDHKAQRLIYMFLMFIISHCIYPFWTGLAFT